MPRIRLSKRYRKKLIQLAALLIVAGISYAARTIDPPANVLGTVAPGYYQVVEVADGDTITVDMDGTHERVRFIGVDTPETNDPRKEVQCFGKAASAFTRELIGNNPVRLEPDEQSTNRDRYNRLLRYIYLPDGRLVQEEIIKHGYGFAYTSFPFTKSDMFRQLQAEALDNNRGLWGECRPIPNDRGGYTSPPEREVINR